MENSELRKIVRLRFSGTVLRRDLLRVLRDEKGMSRTESNEILKQSDLGRRLVRVEDLDYEVTEYFV